MVQMEEFGIIWVLFMSEVRVEPKLTDRNGRVPVGWQTAIDDLWSHEVLGASSENELPPHLRG